jgi:hypothetical protein
MIRPGVPKAESAVSCSTVHNYYNRCYKFAFHRVRFLQILTEERKPAILSAATLLSAQKMIDWMESDKPNLGVGDRTFLWWRSALARRVDKEFPYRPFTPCFKQPIP